MRNLLPLGSVVSLAELDHRVMILGYARYKEGDTSEVYDYVGCYYPEGYTGNDNSMIFNHSQISSLYYLGYNNQDSADFMKKVIKAIEDASPSAEEASVVGVDGE